MKIRNITPATGLVEALRNNGHDPYTAVADIIDNSIDADAENIQLLIEKAQDANSKSKLVIIDDGIGMDEETVVRALVFGDHRDPDSSLGRFGVGLKTSATTIGTDFYVLSKKANGVLVKGVYNPDDIIKTKKWEVLAGETTDPQDIAEFSDYVKSESGTVVVINDLSKHHADNSLNQFKTKLIEETGETFRHFLILLTPEIRKQLKDKSKKSELEKTEAKASLTITVNGSFVYGRDPLEKLLPSTKTLYDDNVVTSLGNVRVTITELQYYPEKDPDAIYGPDHIHQGVNVIRENRQIVAHDNKVFEPIWGARHSSLNHIRAEIRYSKDMDKAFRVNFDKTGLKWIDESVFDKLKSVMRPIIEQSRRNRQAVVSKSSVDNEDLTKVHDSVTNDLFSKRSILDIPNRKKIERKKGNKIGTVHPKGTTVTRSGTKPVDTKIGKFIVEHQSNGTVGPAFDFEFENNMLKIIWNVDHPFVQRFITSSSEDQPKESESSVKVDQVKCLDMVAFSVASYWSQIVSESDDDQVDWEKRDRFFQSIAQNLRVLTM